MEVVEVERTGMEEEEDFISSSDIIKAPVPTDLTALCEQHLLENFAENTK